MISVLPLYEVMSSDAGSRGIIHVISVPNINGLSATVTVANNLFTVPSGCKFIVTGASVRITNLVGTPTVGEMAIKNSAGVSIIPATTLTGLTSTSKFFPLVVSGATQIVDAGDVIYAEMTTGYTVATTVTLKVDLMGYLV